MSFSFGDLFWIFFAFVALQPVIRQRVIDAMRARKIVQVEEIAGRASSFSYTEYATLLCPVCHHRLSRNLRSGGSSGRRNPNPARRCGLVAAK